MSAEQLTPQEASYLLAKLRDDLEYYRSLAANSRCSQQNRDKHHLVENLWLKLAKIRGEAKE
jgi:hypothetical protein